MIHFCSKTFRPVAILLLLAMVAPLSASAEAAGNDGRGFIGFWEGIDAIDGSSVQISISDLNHDGELDVRYRESEFFTCLSDDNTLGRGIFNGQAVVTGPGEIAIAGNLVCINDDNTDGPARQLDLAAQLDRSTDTLVVGPDFDLPLILHRTSK